MEDKEKEIKEAIEGAEEEKLFDVAEHQTGMLDFEDEELLEEEEAELPSLPSSPIGNIPAPEIVEEDVKVQTDGRNFSELSSYEKIKFAAAQNGVVVKKPNTTCNHCHGTGVVSIRTIETEVPTSSGDTSGTEMISEEIPNPCRCIFKKEDMYKMFTGRVPITRQLERSKYKRNRKLIVANSKQTLLEKKRISEKKKANKKAKKKMRKKFNRR